MAQNISLLGASYSNVPAVKLPKTGGGTAQFDDTTDANATANDILTGKTAYVNGTKLTGTKTNPSGTITITENGTGIDVSQYATADVNVQPTQSYSITLTEGFGGNTYGGWVAQGSSQTSTPKYYTNGDSFEVSEGASVYVRATAYGYTPWCTIYMDGTVVKQSTGMGGAIEYTFLMPANDITVKRVEDDQEGLVDIYIELAGGGATLITKTITENGTYDAEDDNADGYSSVTVNVSGGSSTIIDQLNVNGSGTYTAPTGHAYSPVVVPAGSVTAPSSISGTSATVSTGTNTLTLTKSVSVTPNVTSSGYISSGTAGNSSVSLTASVTTKAAATITPGTSNQTISSGTYLTGTQTISGDANLVADNIKSGTTIFGVTGTYSGGGGASNIVQGEFTTGSTGGTTGTFTIPYTGSGYPISLTVVVKGGAYNNSSSGDTTWYNSVSRYDVGVYYMTKSRIPTTPSYESSGDDNRGVVAIIYKNSTSNATSYTRTSTMTAYVYNASSANAHYSTDCVRFIGNGTTVSYYIGNRTSNSTGLARSTTFQYIAVYSK